MKVLFDHNVLKRLRQFLSDHDVRLARELGWAELSNGQLLAVSEDYGFEVMITGDKNLSYQQNLQGRELALIVLSTNDWRVLRDQPEKVVEAVNSAGPGSFQVIPFERVPRGSSS